MGYTHYWYRLQVMDGIQFSLWADDVQRLIENLPATAKNDYDDGPDTLEIAGWDGAGAPVITHTEVSFNGKDPYSHETFRIDRVKEPNSWDRNPKGGLLFACCKTARKPYDLLVTAALVRLKHRFGDAVRVSGDGDAEEWKDGLDFCSQVFGEAKLPFKEYVEA